MSRPADPPNWKGRGPRRERGRGAGYVQMGACYSEVEERSNSRKPNNIDQLRHANIRTLILRKGLSILEWEEAERSHLP